MGEMIFPQGGDPVMCPVCGTISAHCAGGDCLHCLLALADGQEEGSELSWENEGDLPMQKLLGDFQLFDQLGRGGMGIVYRARQRSLGRDVALKLILSGELASQRARRMFQTEALAAGALHHPNIVDVYDCGEVDMQPYLAMRYVPGGKRISDWAVAQREAGDWVTLANAVAQIARALAHAHERGVLHRDLKPSNILWDEVSGPQVTDFGLAKILSSESLGLTVSAQVFGSPGYLAPEQADARLGEVTTATDVYGVGAILYELITGRVPFGGKTLVETLRKAVEDQPEIPTQVPKDLRTICFKCLEKKPEDRYASAAALAEDLEAFGRGEPVSAAPLSTGQIIWRWAKRKPAFASLLLACLLAISCGIIGITWQWQRAEAARRRESSALAEAKSTVSSLYAYRAVTNTTPNQSSLWFALAAAAAPDVAQQENELARWAAWRQEDAVPVRAWNAAVGEGARLEWSHDQTALCIFGLNGREIRSVKEMTVWQPPGLPMPLSTAHDIRWAHHASWMIVAGPEGARQIEYPSGREMARITFSSSRLPRIAISDDDQLVAIGADAPLLWRLSSGVTEPLSTEVGALRRLIFSRDGQHLILVGAKNYAVCATAKPGLLFFEPLPYVYYNTVGFINAESIFSSEDSWGGIEVREITTGKLKHTYKNNTGQQGVPLESSPDGRFIVPDFAPLVQTDQGYSKLPHSPNRLSNAAISFSRDSKHLFTGCAGGIVRHWTLTTGKFSTIGIHQGPISALALSPNEDLLATAQDRGGIIRIWRLGHSPKAHTVPVGAFAMPRLSPNGRWLLPVGTDADFPVLQKTRVYDIESGQPVGPEISPGGSVILDGGFLPDGQTVVLSVSLMKSRRRANFEKDPVAGRVSFWSAKTGQEISPAIDFSTAEPRGVAIHPDGRTVAIYASDESLTEIDVSSRTTRVLVPAPTEGLNRIVFDWVPNTRCRYSPNGRFLFAWGMRLAPIIWDRQQNKKLSSPRETVIDIAVSRDRVAMAAWNAKALVYALPDLRPLKGTEVWESNDALIMTRFSPDGELLFAGGRSGFGHLWRFSDGQPACPAMRHSSEIYTAAFFPDTQCVATAGLTNQIDFWDIRGGLARRPSISNPCHISDLVVTPLGDYLIKGTTYEDKMSIYATKDLLPSPQLAVSAALQLAEIDAAAILDQGELRPVTAEQWMAKWNQFQKENPQWDDLK